MDSNIVENTGAGRKRPAPFELFLFTGDFLIQHLVDRPMVKLEINQSHLHQTKGNHGHYDH
jgi:hypothetical protein